VIETTLGGEQSSHPTLGGCVMLDHLQKAKQYLWAFVEIGFLTVLTVILVYLILGANSGAFVSGVAQNVIKFSGAIPEQSLVGLAIVLAIVFLVAKRMR
jgi:hypothetical protein